MQKHCVFLIILLCCGILSFSQNSPTVKRTIGVSIFLKTGPALCKFITRYPSAYYFSKKEKPFTVNSYSVNAGVEFHLGKTISTQVGINYFATTNQYDFTYAPSNYTFIEINNYKSTCNYLQIPAILKVNFGKRQKFYFSGGMVFGFLIKESISGKRVWEGYDWNIDKNAYRTFINNTILTYTDNEDAIVASIGTEIHLHKNYLIIELYGKKDIAVTRSARFTMNIFGLNIGYRFVFREFSKEKS